MKKGSAYTESDETDPLNVYGQSKLEGEQAIIQAGGAHVILRTSWAYSLRGDGFVSLVLKWARTQETLRIVSDQVGSPSWVRALAETTSQLDFAREILSLDPRREEQTVKRLEPALTADFPIPALRPLRTDLDCAKFETNFEVNPPSWQNALRLALMEW